MGYTGKFWQPIRSRSIFLSKCQLRIKFISQKSKLHVCIRQKPHPQVLYKHKIYPLSIWKECVSISVPVLWISDSIQGTVHNCARHKIAEHSKFTNNAQKKCNDETSCRRHWPCKKKTKQTQILLFCCVYLLGGSGGRFSPLGKKEATTSAAWSGVGGICTPFIVFSLPPLFFASSAFSSYSSSIWSRASMERRTSSFLQQGNRMVRERRG